MNEIKFNNLKEEALNALEKADFANCFSLLENIVFDDDKNTFVLLRTEFIYGINPFTFSQRLIVFIRSLDFPIYKRSESRPKFQIDTNKMITTTPILSLCKS